MTKEALTCMYDSLMHDFYVTCFCMNFMFKYVLGSEVKLKMHRFMSIICLHSRKNVGSCVCVWHFISS